MIPRLHELLLDEHGAALEAVLAKLDADTAFELETRVSKAAYYFDQSGDAAPLRTVVRGFPALVMLVARLLSRVEAEKQRIHNILSTPQALI